MAFAQMRAVSLALLAAAAAQPGTAAAAGRTDSRQPSYETCARYGYELRRERPRDGRLPRMAGMAGPPPVTLVPSIPPLPVPPAPPWRPVWAGRR